jgi:DNA recombination protein RmuC
MNAVSSIAAHPAATFLLGALICLLVVIPIFRARLAAVTAQSGARHQTELALLKQQLENAETAEKELRQSTASLQQALSTEQIRAAELETQLSTERKQTAEKIALLQEARQQLKTEFQQLAQRILEEKSRAFTNQNREQLGHLLDPLRNQISDFRKKIEDVYDKESKDRIALYHQITTLKELNERIGQDAINLTNALKGQVKTQGNWGEMILERVLELSGLVKGREYETQVSLETEEGKKAQPDVIVHLPDKKDVVIDAKVSLLAYQRYCEHETREEKEAALAQHITSIRAHVKGLGGKRYSELNGLRSLDFVLLFIPIEAAFIVAVEHDTGLFKEAFDQNIVIVSPSTLLATLRTIEHTWRSEYQNQNARTIARKAGDLYDKFVNFTTSLEEIGDRLDKAKNAYDTAHKRLVSGQGSIVARVQVLKELGADSRKTIPKALLEETDES